MRAGPGRMILEWSWLPVWSPTSPDTAFAALPPRGYPWRKRSRSIRSDPPMYKPESCRFGFFARIPSVQLDLDVYAGRQLQLHQRVHGLVRGIEDVHEALMGAQLELV